MTLSPWWQQAAADIDTNNMEQAQAHQQQLTKPAGSLGRLEDIAIRFAGFQGTGSPSVQSPHCLVFAADHGVVAQGVSAFPQAVTVEMLKNFVVGGAAISVLAQHNQFALTLVNCGTAIPCDDLEGVIHHPIDSGTKDFSQQPAMNQQQAEQALTIGQTMTETLHQQGCDLLLAGEMGIGNTSAASAMSALLLNTAVADLVGPGTGVQGEALTHKAKVLNASVERAQPAFQQPLDALIELGGFEIGAIAGAYIRAAQLGIPMLVDGFIASAAALLAVRLNSGVSSWLVFTHSSAEPGHQRLLAALDAQPLLDLGMRLGEGSGAGVAISLIRQALALHNGMATFAQADVSEAHE